GHDEESGGVAAVGPVVVGGLGLEHEDARPAVVGLDRRGRAGVAEADDDYVPPLVGREVIGGHSPARRQATSRPAGRGSGCGSTRRHSPVTRGQRDWKLHPTGGSAGSGSSPLSTIRRRPRWATGSGSGTADSRALV